MAKHVNLDELYSEVFLIFLFNTLLIDFSLFAYGQYYYRFSRVSALLWSGDSIIKFLIRNQRSQKPPSTEFHLNQVLFADGNSFCGRFHFFTFFQKDRDVFWERSHFFSFFRRTVTLIENIFHFFQKDRNVFLGTFSLFHFFSRRTVTLFKGIFHLKASLEMFSHQKIIFRTCRSWKYYWNVWNRHILAESFYNISKSAEYLYVIVIQKYFRKLE